MKDWKRRYTLCLRFAGFYTSEYRYDIVHDAYIYYLKKENKDLFSLDLQNESSYLYTVIKKAFYRWYYHERKDAEKYIYSSSDGLTGGFDSQDDILEAKELYDLFYKKLYEETKSSEIRRYRNDLGGNLPTEIFRLKAAGYTQKDIADELKVSKQLVNQYNNKIKNLRMHTNSPFNGCTVNVVKRVKKAEFDKNKEKYLEEWEMGDKSDYNEFYTLMTSKTNPNEGLLIKGKDSD